MRTRHLHKCFILRQSTGMGRKRNAESTISDTISHSGSPTASSMSKDLRAVRSGQALRDALLALLAERSFEQITIRDICARAGVHYATFFRHHSTRESLLDDIAKGEIRHLNDLALAIRGSDAYEASLIALCQYVDDHRELWSVLLNGGAGSAMREEWLRQSQRVAAAETPANSWLPPDLGTICAATLIAETLAWWVAQPPNTFSAQDLAGILSRLLFASIVAPD